MLLSRFAVASLCGSVVVSLTLWGAIIKTVEHFV
jgi:hypothetical protein